MARSVPEWIGKTPDTRVPARVRKRVWERDGKQCRGCTRPLPVGTPFQTDHIKEIILGGENRESNLQTLGEKCCATHKEKTKEAVRLKAQGDRKLSRLLGTRRPSRNPVPGSRNTRFKKRLDGTVVDRATGEVISKRRA